MRDIESPQQRRSRLVRLIGNPGSPATMISTPGRRTETPPMIMPAVPPSPGTLRTELEKVQQKLRAVTIDTPTESIAALLQEEAALTLRLSRGEAELARIENEINQAQHIAESAAMSEVREQQERQRKHNVALAQIALIDDQLAGRKLIKPAGHLKGTDIQDDIQRQKRELQQLRERVMQEAGLTEADIPLQPAPVNKGIRPDGGGGVRW